MRAGVKNRGSPELMTYGGGWSECSRDVNPQVVSESGQCKYPFVTVYPVPELEYRKTFYVITVQARTK